MSLRWFFFIPLALTACGQQDHSVALGGSCSYDSDCAPATDGAQVNCSCGSCEASYSVPLICGNPGRACNADETCAFSAGGSGGCMPSAQAGDSCASVNCVPGLFCNTANRCVPPAAVGGPCTVSDEESCAAPAFCDGETATCAAPRAIGGACDWTRYERAECVAGAACSLESNTCVEQKLNGAICTDDAGCLSDYCTPLRICQTRGC